MVCVVVVVRSFVEYDVALFDEQTAESSWMQYPGNKIPYKAPWSESSLHQICVVIVVHSFCGIDVALFDEPGCNTRERKYPTKCHDLNLVSIISNLTFCGTALLCIICIHTTTRLLLQSWCWENFFEGIQWLRCCNKRWQWCQMCCMLVTWFQSSSHSNTNSCMSDGSGGERRLTSVFLT